MRRRNFLGTSAALGGLGLLAACAPGSDGGGGEGGGAPAPAADEVDTDIAALGDITLVVWDQEVRGAQNDAIEALLGAFGEKYPNVTVERNSQSFDDLQQQTGAVGERAPVPVGAQVRRLGEKPPHDRGVRALQLDAVEAALPAVSGDQGVAGDHLGDLPRRQPFGHLAEQRVGHR